MSLNVLYPGMLMILTVHDRQIAELKLLCAQKKVFGKFRQNGERPLSPIPFHNYILIRRGELTSLLTGKCHKQHGGKCAASSLLPRPRILRRLLDRVFLFAFLANFYMHLVSVHR